MQPPQVKPTASVTAMQPAHAQTSRHLVGA
jgi:hypothetical protein